MDDDDNEAGMADCDCLSEYQDDAGEMLTQREPRGDPAEIPCHVTLLSPPQPEYSTQGGPLHNGARVSTIEEPRIYDVLIVKLPCK